MAKLTIPAEELMNSGHIGCLGCGGTLAMRYLLKALGKRTIVTIPACCWAIMSGVYPRNVLKVPLLDVAFETTGASASGIRAALDAKGIDDVYVVGFAGDGGTADIGIQALSGAAERGDDIIYVMYDNEAYMNTGIQRSGATPFGAWTTTTPVGATGDFKKRPKKNMVEIMVAHEIPYAATANVAYPEDFVKKVQKAKDMPETKFFHVFSPCPTGWRFSPEMTIRIGVLAHQTGIFPLYEVENGVYKMTKKPAKRKPVGEYLRLQGRFRHLTDDLIETIQKNVDRNWETLLAKEEFTQRLGE
ncbi:MAG: 3-methyl-2-oxobutanoate dehydrogenase subunit beta [Thermoplasmata archaeon]